MHKDNFRTKLCTCNITENTEVDNTGIYVAILTLEHISANRTLVNVKQKWWCKVIVMSVGWGYKN